MLVPLFVFHTYAQRDSTKIKKDTTVKAKQLQSTDLNSTVTFHAKDSIIFDFRTNTGIMFKESNVKYKTNKLEAGEIRYYLDNSTVSARPQIDSMGKATGTPLLIEKSQKVQADSIDYNLDSERGILTGIVTKHGEGYIGGERLKKNADNELFLDTAYYTTCDLAHPHYRIKARRIKLTKRGNVIAGPFNLEIADTPTPLGFLFGVFPRPKRKTSGVLIPVYGESRTEGFYLRNGGYYWAISDKVDLRVTGELYTYGNWGINTASSYFKRYYYRGGANFAYNTRFAPETLGELERSKTKQFWINWNHTPISRGTGRFSANVRAGSSTFNKTSSFELQNQINSSFNSSITYSKTFRGTPFSLNASARSDQQTSQNLVNLTLPSFNFSMNRIYPFRTKTGSTKGFIKNISVSYSNSASVNITNRVTGTSGGFRTIGARRDSTYKFKANNFDLFLRNADIRLSHSIPVSAPYKLLKYINGTVNFNFNQNFHRESYDYEWIASQKAVKIDTSKALGTSYNYSMGTSLSTNVYGIYYLRKSKRLKALRHMIQPSIGFNYSPDFTKASYGFYYKDVQIGINPDNTPLLRDLPKYRNVAGSGPSGSISFSLRNSLEGKFKPKEDTATTLKKVKILDELSASTSYNILADSFNLSNISLNARTRIQRLLDINIRGTLDPYYYLKRDNGSIQQQDYYYRTKEYAWDNGKGIGTLTSASLSLSTSLSPDIIKSKNAGQSDNTKIQQQQVYRNNPQLDPNNLNFDPNNPNNPYMDPNSPDYDPTLYDANGNLLDPTRNPMLKQPITQSAQQNPDLYVDFDIPWSLNVNYNRSYNKYPRRRVTESLSFSGDLSLTPKWRVGFNSTYDFNSKQLTATQINLFRDLHCWEMRFFWQPFGTYQSYSFTINVRSSILKDLKYDRKRTWYDR